MSRNRFSPPFCSDSKKIDEFRHAKQVLLVNPISSLVVKWIMTNITVDPHAPLPTLFPGHLWLLIEWSLIMHGMGYVAVAKSLGLYQDC